MQGATRAARLGAAGDAGCATGWATAASRSICCQLLLLGDPWPWREQTPEHGLTGGEVREWVVAWPLGGGCRTMVPCALRLKGLAEAGATVAAIAAASTAIAVSMGLVALNIIRSSWLLVLLVVAGVARPHSVDLVDGHRVAVGVVADRRGPWRVLAPEPGPHAVQGCAELRDVDVWVVERAVAAVGEQFAQRCDRCRGRVRGAFERSGDLEQVAAYRGCAVMQQRLAAAGDRIPLPSLVSGPAQPLHDHAAAVLGATLAPSLADAEAVPGCRAGRGRGGLGRTTRVCMLSRHRALLC